MKNKGFTLIELLVVVSIISLLSSIAITSLNGAKAKARNSTRLQNIVQLRNAFNLGLSSANSYSYPDIGNSWACISSTCYGSFSSYTSNTTVDAFLSSGMPQKPSDPVGGLRVSGGYIYSSDFTWSPNLEQGSYIIWAMEPPGSCAPGVEAYEMTTTTFCGLKLK